MRSCCALYVDAGHLLSPDPSTRMNVHEIIESDRFELRRRFWRVAQDQASSGEGA